MYLVRTHGIYLIYTVPHLQKIKCVFKNKRQEVIRNGHLHMFVLSLDPWGLRGPLKAKVAMCPRTGGSYTPVRVCTHLHTYVHTSNALCSRSGHLQKKEGHEKEKQKAREGHLYQKPLPAWRWPTSTTSGAWQASEGLEELQERPEPGLEGGGSPASWPQPWHWGRRVGASCGRRDRGQQHKYRCRQALTGLGREGRGRERRVVRRRTTVGLSSTGTGNRHNHSPPLGPLLLQGPCSPVPTRVLPGWAWGAALPVAHGTTVQTKWQNS